MGGVAALLTCIAFALPAQAQPACQFALGFATLRDLIGAETVGGCLEDEHPNPENGDALQRTTGGLLVWRQADNVAAFTDGARTWMAVAGHAVSLPNGFTASVFASGVDGARAMALAPDGDVYVTATGPGRVYRLRDANRDGLADAVETWLSDLQLPHGIAVRDGYLYVAETHQVVRYRLAERAGAPEVVVPDLPHGAGHYTRTILFAPDGRLYVSVGSSCNACTESDERRAAISLDGRVIARGLRNAVGLSLRPDTGELWATVNGRDNLGDEIPPDALYRVQEGMDGGWPRCLPDGSPDPQLGRPGTCGAIAAPAATFPAHSAPLGLRFYDGAMFPSAYKGSLFVALHGSWNRSTPIGYQVVRVPFDGDRVGQPEPFLTGFLPPGRGRADVWARPVDLLVASDGALLVSDDEGGYLLRVTTRP